MTRPKHNGEDQNFDAPEKLVSVLRQSRPEPVFVPPTLDEAVLQTARNHLSKGQGPRFRWLPLLPWLAAAAAMIVAGFLFFFAGRSSNPRNPATFAREDVNHDGRVDILDAFALARQLKQAKVSDLHLDLNGDGVVDERDMEIIASEAVKLDKGGRS